MAAKLFLVTFIALFQRSVQEYIGCFRDQPAGTDLNGLLRVFILGNSPDSCVQFCTENDYLYAGVELGFNCYCGNSFGRQGAVSSSECSWSCPKPYSDQLCGGDMAIAVYSTGVEKCYCQAHGDPHYKTFDGRKIHFQGDCTYTLIRAGTTECGVKVLGKNQPFRRNSRVATTKEITVEVWTKDTKDIIWIGQDKHFTINGVPYNGMVFRDHFEVMTLGKYVTVANKCGMEIMFDGQMTAKFYIPKTDAKYNVGICGTCNDDKNDDFFLKNGTDANALPDKYALIGNSYWEPGENEQEKHCNRIEEQPQCSDDIKAQIADDTVCGYIKSSAGPFKDCIPLVDMGGHVNALYEDCEYDVCVAWGDDALVEEQVCSHMGSFQDECNGKLAEPMNFRSATFCPMDCGEHMVYEPAITTIQPACKTKDNAATEYNGPAQEGCVCDKDYFYDDGKDRCVTAAECGCVTDDDNYFPVGDGFLLGDCATQKVCVNEGGVIFMKEEEVGWQCGDHEKCDQPVAGLGLCDCEVHYIRNALGVCEEINFCVPDPCMNGGKCVRSPGEYTCDCAAHYTGEHCETEINYCDSGPCQNGGVCNREFGGYTCDCTAEYTGDNCEIEINLCDSGPCLNGGVCTNAPGTYSCDCPVGFEGTNCETEINLCDSDPCLNGGVCTNAPGTYSCDCPVGFEGTNCETELNLCDSGPCLNGGVCTNAPGTYSCDCPVDFEGTNCETEINLCEPNPCLNNGICIRLTGAYMCDCDAHYTGDNCENEINYCDSNPCQNNGQCVSEFGGYTCDCPVEFTGDNCEIAVDLCDPNPCLNGGVCSSALGAYSCDCTAQYTGTNCETEIDFCNPNPCLNSGTCNPEAAGYTCTCTNLYEGDNCEIEIDLCDPNPCHNGGVCTQAGETYSCDCPADFVGDHCEEAVQCAGETQRVRCSSAGTGYKECAAPGEILGLTIIRELDGSTGCVFHPNPPPADEDYDGGSGFYGFDGVNAWATYGCRMRVEMCYTI